MRPLYEIAKSITDNWEHPYYGAVPYIVAMENLDKITESYGCDSATYVVNGFLANANTWRGEIARNIKIELKEILKRG